MSGLNITSSSGFSINGGFTVTGSPTITTANLVLHLDACVAESYPGNGSTWTDLVASKEFTLHGGPTYSSSGGGYLQFTPANSQYADSTTSLSSLSNWTAEVWHYYDGTNTGLAPCILTEKWPNSPSQLNYNLGALNPPVSNTDLQAGVYNGTWHSTPVVTLTTGWHHIAGTYDGATIKLYVDNAMVSNVSYNGGASSGTEGIRIMRRWDAADYWGGKLAVVRIYSSDIGASGIDRNYKAQKGRFGL